METGLKTYVIGHFGDDVIN
ncbi:uncharacterized protein G2W53_014623 [Senna tora]|uniref:Uncharacterized protein n=1 Tax=Senna tora TaxID=362788 RepID=A0A835C615_9FABA|nr:uncharacterized protein G2W53_014623 [Senna tora]